MSGVELVVDIRAVPLSRRPGFSKSRLESTLKDAGIGYIHLQKAGNPFRKQSANTGTVLESYRAYLHRSPEILDKLGRLLAGHRTVLLCLEEESEHCHRS